MEREEILNALFNLGAEKALQEIQKEAGDEVVSVLVDRLTKEEEPKSIFQDALTRAKGK